VVDQWVRVSDRAAFAMARRVTREEGILAGESSGTAVAAALLIARGLVARNQGRGSTVVVVLPDTGRNYLSKLYDDDWMESHDLFAAAEGGTAGVRLIPSGDIASA
jgi:cystathionine beta-synthase